MFDFVRKHNRLMQFLLLLLILPAFVLFGFSSYQGGNAGPTVATVGSHKITQTEWDQEVNRRSQEMRARDPNFDVKQMDKPEEKYRILENLVRRQVLTQSVADMRLPVSDAQVAQVIAQDPNVLALKDADGKVDMQRYAMLLAQNGLTPATFEEQMRRDIAINQLLGNVFSTSPKTPALYAAGLDALFQQREVQVARFQSANYLTKVNLTDAQVEQYYKDHAALFQAPEQASIQYLVLDGNSLAANLQFKDEEIKSYYEQNKARFAGSQERRASHILFGVDAKASAAEKDKVKAQAQAVLEAVKKAPATFAAQAKQHSQDTVSAEQGGDLNFFARGTGMAQPLEEVVFNLQKGQIAPNLVSTEFGYHIVMLTDVKGQVQSFEQARPEIVEALRKEQARKKFAEESEKFSNAVEDNDNLADVAKQFGLTLKSAQGLGRNGIASDEILGNPQFLQAVFAPDVLAKKRNTVALDLGKLGMVSAQVLSYTPMQTKPFAQVKEQARHEAQAAKAQELAAAEGAAKLAAWKSAPASAALEPAITVSRDQTQNLAAVLQEAIMKAPVSPLPQWLGVALPNAQGYAVVRINKVLPRNTANEQAKQMHEGMAQVGRQSLSNAEAAAFVDLLRKQLGAKVKVAKPLAGAEALAPKP